MIHRTRSASLFGNTVALRIMGDLARQHSREARTHPTHDKVTQTGYRHRNLNGNPVFSGLHSKFP
jgi:hypothetical protein